MNYNKFKINRLNKRLLWSKIIKKNFDFKNGQGLAQLSLKHLFSRKDCEDIYKAFNSNLNWIVRDGQKLKVKKKQLKTSRYLLKIIDYFLELLQNNIPEKKHVNLTLETLRVARSDGTQHQVGSRWHQDHEAYFSLLINLTESLDPNFSTRFFNLVSGEKYILKVDGNPVVENHWKENSIKPFHLGIINSGVRHFLFPFDRCRPIVHHAPNLKNKRLAIFATFSISGIEQGMDLKDVYIPISKLKNSKQKNDNLKNLRNQWRKILGIENSLTDKSSFRLFKSKYELYNINCKKINLLSKNRNNQVSKNQPRIVNFGLKQFQNEIIAKKKLLYRAIPIGALSRSLNFFSEIGKHCIKKLIKKKNLNLRFSDCSLFGNNNYDLLVQFKQPKKAFQLLSINETLNHINDFVLILYSDGNNFIYSKKKCNTFSKSLPFKRKGKCNDINFLEKKFTKKTAQIFASFNLNNFLNLKNSFLISYSLQTVWSKGIKEIVANNKNKYFLMNKKNFYKKVNIILNQNFEKNIENVPFFLPRVGVNRTLPEINSNSKVFKSSKKVLCI